MDRIDDSVARAIATRVRALLSAFDGAGLEAAARRLGVSEVALRMTVDDVEPHPTLEALAAVTRHFGVDPTWLLTGTYDPATHHAAMDGGRPEDSLALVATLVRRPLAEGEGVAHGEPIDLRATLPADAVDALHSEARRAADEYLRRTEPRAPTRPDPEPPRSP